MAGGNFLGRIISYVVNELVVEGLANKYAFPDFDDIFVCVRRMIWLGSYFRPACLLEREFIYFT